MKKKSGLKIALSLIVILLLVLGCLFVLNHLGKEKLIEHTDITIITSGKELVVQAEIAVTADEHRSGLMYRDDLCDDCGMFFMFDRNTQSGFWMKNCIIPLDLIFFDENGTVVDIKEDFEPCDQDPCSVHIPDKQYRYVLEVNSGWCNQNGVDLESVLDLTHR